MAKARGGLQDPQIEVFDPVGEINKKFDFYIKIVVGVFVIGLVTMLIMVATLVIDSFHINSATYREYSQKIESQNSLLESNRQNQEMIKTNQEVIKDLQRQIRGK